MTVPGEPVVDPQRGRSSVRHHAWNAHGAQPQHFEWVQPCASLQWAAFQRTIRRLRDRGNDILVILGPFNEHMIAEDQRPTYQAIREKVAAWLDSNRVPHIVPQVLPSELYADASHPLTDGYRELARRIWSDRSMTAWRESRP